MKKAVKDTLLSVIVLTAIALVCVILLSVANEFLKYEAKLDADMAKKLYSVCPTGEETDQKALEYFEIVEMDDKIALVNEKHGNAKTQIVAVYRATKGINKGKYIIQAQSEGYGGTVMMLTSYDEEGAIIKSTCIAHDAESHWGKLEGHTDFDTLVGKSGEVGPNDIVAITGATKTRTGLAQAVTISNKMAQSIANERFKSVMVADEYENVTATLGAQIVSVNALAPDENTKVLKVFKAKGGENDGCYIVISQSKNGQWYPPLRMMTAYTADGKIYKTECIYQAEGYWDKMDESSFSNATGKSGALSGDEFVGTGATNTRVTIAKAINIATTLVETLIGGNL